MQVVQGLKQFVLQHPFLGVETTTTAVCPPTVSESCSRVETTFGESVLQQHELFFLVGVNDKNTYFIRNCHHFWYELVYLLPWNIVICPYVLCEILFLSPHFGCNEKKMSTMASGRRRRSPLLFVGRSNVC